MTSTNATLNNTPVTADLIPWNNWPDPEIHEVKTSNVRCEVVDNEYSSGRLLLVDTSLGEIGYPSLGGLANIGKKIQIPTLFVNKLSLPLQAAIINERFASSSELSINMVKEPFQRSTPEGLVWSERNLVTNIIPGWREVVSHREICAKAWEIMAGIWGGENLEIETARRGDSSMLVRILSPMEQEVTKGGRQLGDVLRAGIEIEHAYGFDINVRLFTKRLVCLNGMTTNDIRFSWKSGALSTKQNQLDFILMGIAEAFDAFEELIDKCRTMAGINLEGNPELILLERAKAMKLPARYNSELLTAWRQEPVATEYGVLNALTRMASHSEVINDITRREVQSTAGQWAQNFDMVTARMPRQLAGQVGAHIIDDIDSIDEV